MLTDNFWKRRFHGDREIIGRFGYRRAAPQNSIRWWRYAMRDAIYDLRSVIFKPSPCFWSRWTVFSKGSAKLSRWLQQHRIPLSELQETQIEYLFCT